MIDKFKAEISNSDASYIASKWINENIPYIFNADLDQYVKWKLRLAGNLGVDSRAIAITGSAAVGFSLNPAKNLKAFSGNSDIDVAIISQYHFDVSWFYLRGLGTKVYSFNLKERNAIDDHKTRLIYWGTIATDKIIQILPFGKEWVLAANDMASVSPTEGRVINMRIYKDFEALRAYQIIGLKAIKDKLIEE